MDDMLDHEWADQRRESKTNSAAADALDRQLLDKGMKKGPPQSTSPDYKRNSAAAIFAPALPVGPTALTDVGAMRAALGLQKIWRYLDQKHWSKESAKAHAFDEAEPGLKLENVAAHSWQVADAVLLLAPTFPEINLDRALRLAVLHDKLELITGDFDPVGDDGLGTHSHAFNATARHRKREAELAALEQYLKSVREPSRSIQREALLEIINIATIEACFVKAVDKLQALTYVIEKKNGLMSDEHIDFTVRFAGQAVDHFPGLETHLAILVGDLLTTVAKRRKEPSAEVVARLPPVTQSFLKQLLK